MGSPRKTVAALAVGVAGVLGMAGVAAAAHGGSHASSRSARTTPHAHHQGRHHASSAAVANLPGVSTTTEPEHVLPEPGDDRGNDAAANEDENTSTTLPGETTTSMPDETSTSTPDEITTSMPDETTTSMPAIPNGVQTFTVAGGTVTVDIEDGVLTLVSTTPNAGFEVDKSEARPDRVEVEFRSGDSQARVRVRIDDGRLRVETGDN